MKKIFNNKLVAVPLLTAVIIIVGTTFWITTRAQVDNYQAEIGKKAPNFTLTDFNDGKHSLNDYQGKPTVLIFWYSSCLPCLETLKQAEALNLQSPNQVVYLVIHRSDLESPARTKLIAQNLKISLPLLKDLNGEIFKQYKFNNNMPLVYFINNEGIIKERLSGDVTEENLATNVQKLLNQN